jgi:hypothetical protein|tara:strand:+ start:304 stop:555 length:252 start_codon:yes stop_codon:yes gene_type:complete
MAGIRSDIDRNKSALAKVRNPIKGESPSDPTFDYTQKSTTLNKKYKPEYQDDFAMKKAAKGFAAGVVGLIGKAIHQGKKRGYI